MNSNKKYTLLILILFILFIIFSFRWAYTQPYDPVYMQDLYDHSQWSVPQSVRTQGDDGRYEVAGYHLIKGGKLYQIAPEVPPLGEYLIGASLLFLHNSKILMIGFYLLSIVIFYKITSFYSQNQNRRIFAVLLYASTPPVISQLGVTMLDIIQLTALLLHMWYILRLQSAQSKYQTIAYTALAGLSAGLFISIKFGIFIIPILIVDWFLLKQFNKAKLLIPIILITPIIYVLSTAPYFFQGGTMQSWISTQKWILNFYKTSNSGFFPGMAFITTTMSLFKGWWGGSWDSWDNWSIILPIGLYLALKNRKQVPPHIKYQATLILVTLVFLSFTAFWPRYLLLIIPSSILLLLTQKFSTNTAKFLLIISMLQSLRVLFPQPVTILGTFQSNMQNATYQEVYGLLDTQTKKTMSRDAFWRIILKVDKNLRLKQKNISYKAPYTFPWTSQVMVPIQTTYKTEIGELKHKTNIQLMRKNNKWEINWKWDTIAPNFSSTDTIKTTIKEATQGALISYEGAVLSQGSKWPYIFIIPGKITDEEATVKKIEELTRIQGFIVHKLYQANAPYDTPAPIGFAFPEYDQNKLVEIQKNPGIVIQYETTRVYNPELVAKGELEKIKTIETRNIGKLVGTNGGTITLVKANHEEKTLLQTQPKNGETILVDYK